MPGNGVCSLGGCWAGSVDHCAPQVSASGCRGGDRGGSLSWQPLPPARDVQCLTPFPAVPDGKVTQPSRVTCSSRGGWEGGVTSPPLKRAACHLHLLSSKILFPEHRLCLHLPFSAGSSPSLSHKLVPSTVLRCVQRAAWKWWSTLLLEIPRGGRQS